jgi:hypothetical protein
MADANQAPESERIFNRETLLDLTVNFIPLGIILFFVVLFLVYRPFGVELVPSVIMMALLVLPFAALAILTYFAGRVITEAERRGESETAEAVAENTMEIGEGADEDAEDAAGKPAEFGDNSDGSGNDKPAAVGGDDQSTTGSRGTSAPAGAGTDRAQRTHSDAETSSEETEEDQTEADESTDKADSSQ